MSALLPWPEDTTCRHCWERQIQFIWTRDTDQRQFWVCRVCYDFLQGRGIGPDPAEPTPQRVQAGSKKLPALHEVEAVPMYPTHDKRGTKCRIKSNRGN